MKLYFDGQLILQLLCPKQLLDFLNGTSIFGDETLVDVFVTNYTVKGMYAIVEFRIDTTNSNLNSSYIDSVFTESLPSNRVFGSFHRIAEDGKLYFLHAPHPLFLFSFSISSSLSLGSRRNPEISKHLNSFPADCIIITCTGLVISEIICTNFPLYLKFVKFVK